MQSPGLALTFSLTLVGLAACGTVPDGPDAVTADDEGRAVAAAVADEDEVAALPLQPLSIVVAPTASTHLRALTADAVGRDVLVGSFIVGCGIGLDKGPFAAVVDEAGDFTLTLTLPQDAAQIAMAVGVVDVDGNGAFDASIDDVFVAGGYGGLAVSDDGFVELAAAADDDLMAQIAASMLFERVNGDVE